MLHARFRGRQVRAGLAAALLAAALWAAATGAAHAARPDDLATADMLSRSGQHAEAAENYESLAKRTFRAWDARLALLAAREYLAAGRLDDADRMLARAGGELSGDDRVLAARVQAELALARGRPQAALDALARLPEPWPAPLAVELLGLRARAEFAAGRMLEGMRTVEARARLLGTVDERRANYDLLVEALRASPGAAAAVPAGATPYERAWFELAAVLAAAPPESDTLARSAAEWRVRHPDHPGGMYLPESATTAAGAAASGAPAIAAPANVIGLLLPLSGKLEAAGRAVRDGFLAAALAEPAGSRPRIEIEDTVAAGPAAAYDRALESGATAVAGPLAKEEIAALVAAQTLPVPTLALNAVPLDTPPPFLFQFALDPEQEARAVARRIAADGRGHGIALFPNNAWGQRLHAAFTAELQATGVELSAAQFYEPSASDFSGPLRAALGRFAGAGDRGARGAPPPRDPVAEARDGPQFAFIAASAAAARALVPQLRFQMTYTVPVYATSDALEPGSRPVPDLDGVVFPEMPWVVGGGQGAPELWDLLQGEWSGAARGRLRLYAFGYDAYRLLRGLGTAVRGGGVNGLTGRLTVAPDGRVQREPDWAQVERGRPQFAGPALIPAPVGP